MVRLTSFIAQRWKLILNIVTVVALLLLLIFIRHDLITTFRNLLKVNAWALVLMVPLEALNYHAQTKLYQLLFRIVGHKLKYKKLMIASLELNFVNHIFPSGGAAGISYFSLRLKDESISGAKATMIQFMKLLLSIFSFESLILISVFFLSIGGQVNRFMLLVSAILSTLLVVSTLVFIYTIGNRQRINRVLEFFTVWLNRLLRWVRPSDRDAINIVKARVVFDELHDTFMEMRRDKTKMREPLLYALLMNVTEVAVIYVVFLAFGHFVNPGAVIIAYGIANFAGFISVLPGGIGVYETLMIAVLLAAGVSPNISVPVIIMYRVLNTLLQLPAGYFYYQKEISQHGKPPRNAEIL